MLRLGVILGIVVGLLWSNLCAAQCRLLPLPETQAQKAKAPPCHQKQQSEQKPKASCGDALFEGAEKAFDTAAFAVPPAFTAALSDCLGVSTIAPPLQFGTRPHSSPPPFPIRV